MDPAVGLFSGVMLFIVIFWIVFIAVLILALVFWIMMLIDAINRKYPGENDKLVWILVIVLVGVIGAIIYYFVVKKAKK